MENSRTKADEYSPLTLAFVGDAVFDLLVRDMLVSQANRPVGELNREKVSVVNCSAQARIAEKLMGSMTEKEIAVYKRGRNAAPKCTPKNGSVADYHSATGLEALFGYLHINGDHERVKELFALSLS